MSLSLRRLKTAVRDFASRPIEEDIDPDDLRNVIDELENEWEMLDESPELRARLEETLAKAIRTIKEAYGSRG